MKLTKELVDKIVQHLDLKSPAYRESFERLLSVGGQWNEKTPDVLECFDRYIIVKDNGETVEL